MLQLFGPLFRNRYFIDLLRAEAELASEAAWVMWRGMEDYGLCSRGGFRKIERGWRRAGRIDRYITELLKHTVITPIDAEDIRSISVRLNGILESLTEAAWEQSALQAASVPVLLTRMYESAFHCSKDVVLAVASLPKGKPLTETAFLWRETHRQVKNFQRSLIADLMEREADPISVMRWKHVYELTGSVLKRFDVIAYTLERARLRNN